MHSGCTLPKELSEDKCICLLCKEQPPVTQPHTAEIQTRESPEDTAGQVDLMTIQADAVMTTEEHMDVPEVTPRHKGLVEPDQIEASANTETPMDLGKCKWDRPKKKIVNECFLVYLCRREDSLKICLL